MAIIDAQDVIHHFASRSEDSSEAQCGFGFGVVNFGALWLPIGYFGALSGFASKLTLSQTVSGFRSKLKLSKNVVGLGFKRDEGEKIGIWQVLMVRRVNVLQSLRKGTYMPGMR